MPVCLVCRAVRFGTWREAEQIVMGFCSTLLAFLRAEKLFGVETNRLTASTVLVAGSAFCIFLLAIVSGGQRRQMYRRLQVCALSKFCSYIFLVVLCALVRVE